MSEKFVSSVITSFAYRTDLNLKRTCNRPVFNSHLRNSQFASFIIFQMTFYHVMNFRETEIRVFDEYNHHETDYFSSFFLDLAKSSAVSDTRFFYMQFAISECIFKAIEFVALLRIFFSQTNPRVPMSSLRFVHIVSRV